MGMIMKELILKHFWKNNERWGEASENCRQTHVECAVQVEKLQSDSREKAGALFENYYKELRTIGWGDDAGELLSGAHQKLASEYQALNNEYLTEYSKINSDYMEKLADTSLDYQQNSNEEYVHFLKETRKAMSQESGGRAAGGASKKKSQ